MYFYSHVPRGTRPKSSPLVIETYEFLLTRPSRDATQHGSHFQNHTEISTHTSLAGRDAGRCTASGF